MKTRKIIYRQTLTDGKRKIRIRVPITEVWLNGGWCVSGDEWAKVEAEIERKWPGWFHTCYNKTPCLACACGRMTVGKKR
jgi:hypothetical protein